MLAFVLPVVLGIAFYREYREPKLGNWAESIETEMASFDLIPEAPQENAIQGSAPDERIEGQAPLVNLSGLHSPYAVLTEWDSGDVVAEENSEIKLYPASLTKIMTIILAIELSQDLDQAITMEKRYFEQLFELDAAVAGFQVGERVTFRDLLYGAMLPSGADACLALAYILAGSEPAYVELMNEKAASLGLEDTRFNNTTGLHDPKNYSSVSDIANLLRYALQNEDFFQIFTTKEYTTAPTNMSPQGVGMRSSVIRHLKNFPELEPLMLGGKTGFTEQAGLCLASLALVDGEYYILVTAGAGAQIVVPGMPIVAINEPLHLEDAARVYIQLEQTREAEKES